MALIKFLSEQFVQAKHKLTKNEHTFRIKVKSFLYETANQAEHELNRLNNLSGSNDAKYNKIIGKLDTTETKTTKLRENVDSAQIAIENKKKQIDEQMEKMNEARKKGQQARSMAMQSNKESTEAMKLLKIIEDAISK